MLAALQSALLESGCPECSFLGPGRLGLLWFGGGGRVVACRDSLQGRWWAGMALEPDCQDFSPILPLGSWGGLGQVIGLHSFIQQIAVY